MGHGAVWDQGVVLRELDLRAAELCSPRFVPLPDRDVPDRIGVYRVQASGDEIPGTDAEAEEWERAADEFLDAMSVALRQLYLDHRGFRVYGHVDLRAGTWRDRHVPRPFPLPGRRRRITRRSHEARRRSIERAEQAAAAYRPVREEIERRLAELRAHRAALPPLPADPPRRGAAIPPSTSRGTSHHSSHGSDGSDAGSPAGHGVDGGHSGFGGI
jgi:hypothetical protein